MTHSYQNCVKPFIRDEILHTVKELHLTQEETAEILRIDIRSFAYLAAGKTMCSATTLLVYLTLLCPDPLVFIEELRKVIQEAERSLV